MKRSAINLIFLLALTGSSWGAVPLIKEFSSSGGNPANKDNDQDIMYLVQPGDSISFRVTADQQVSYEWTVNKSTKAGRGVTVPAVSDIFNWTAPDEKGVWEIHLRCWNTLSEETQKEWVVSTLTLAEAPVIFESFSDGKYNKRADTDPWGRTFNWTSPSGSLSGRVFTQVTANDLKGLFLSGAIGKDFGIYINSDVLYGTWDFYFRFPNGGNTAYNDNLYVYPASANAIPSFPLIKLYHAADEHIGTDYFDGNGKWHPFTTRDHNGAAYSALGSISDICEGNSIGIGTGWHRMRFIRDKRTGYNLLWQGLETVEEPFIAENFYYSKDLEKAKSLFFGLNEDGAATDGVNSLQQIDQIAVYNEIYLYPKKKVVVSPTKITVKNGLDPSSLWNLKELAHAVNDVSKMKYSDDTKTGYVHVDTLDFNYATGFEMNNETLVFTSTNNPQWKWRSGLYMKLNHVKVIGQNNILLIDASNVETIRNKKVKNKMHIDISSSSFININGPKFNNGSVSMQHLSISNSYFLLNKTATRGRPMALAFGFSQNELYNWDIMLNNNIFEMTKGAF
ncbi:MAG: hypothetical protein KKG09_09835, partial [Verrucomicrobia bacterium]|nr:hypothetical protein [Verrucomicrobiota bacterium]MCG2681471.1 hypothetical protein [Kiritimatiellia bacterium]